jgi:adenosyl cobinamide kinase/adenosyl cobinamide phosphate guanylyltransferase
MTDISLVLGGARSGKSRYAEALLMRAPPPWVYLATAEAFDAEMAARIASHRARRDPRWDTLEAPRDLPAQLAAQNGPVLVDCLTLWLSNLMLADMSIEQETAALIAALDRPAPTVLVANEVGLSIVPDNALARAFRDAAGALNQRLAALADRVVLTVAGLPMHLKGPP